MLFDFDKHYALEDANVQLRPLETNDLAHLKYFSEQEPDTWKFSLVQPIGVEGMSDYIRTAIEARAAKKEYPFIVYDKIKNRYAGSTRFYDMQLQNKTCQLGYTWYGTDFRGTELNKHCKFLMLQFAFEELGMERVEFRANNNNERSKAAMKSIGCVVEGILRNNGSLANGDRYDGIVLSILKTEWFSSVKENLLKKIN